MPDMPVVFCPGCAHWVRLSPRELGNCIYCGDFDGRSAERVPGMD